nr:right-handed parallel beta-helix repeat-containing protein [Candidatus Sigynarchaeota archaeon]
MVKEGMNTRKQIRFFSMMVLIMLFGGSILMRDRMAAAGSIQPAEALPPQTIDGNAALASFCAAHGSGNGSAINPFIIENKQITASGTGNCFFLNNTNAHVTFRNCTFYMSGVSTLDWDAGIKVNNCSHVRISGCTIHDNLIGISVMSSSLVSLVSNNISFSSAYSIMLDHLNSTTIQGNRVWNSTGWGIYLTVSTNNTIISNTVTNCTAQAAIGLNFGVDNNTVDGNTLQSNEFGIYIQMSKLNVIQFNNVTRNHRGVAIMNSDNNSVIANNISLNIGGDTGGIIVGSGDNNSIIGNDVSNNGPYGIRLSIPSVGNIIYLNRFANNEVLEGALQSPSRRSPAARSITLSDSSTNAWDNGTLGNYWGNYTAVYPTATNNGTTWNTPYEIADLNMYEANQTDNHPLVNWPYIPPSTPPALPGYDVALMLAGISVALCVLILQKLRFKKIQH